MSEDLRVVVASLADWMATSSLPWAAYRSLMACCLVAHDKRPGVCPVGIGETLHRALAKLIMRAARDQANTACGNLQLCAGLEVDIEGSAHAVGQRRLARVREILGEEEEEEDSTEEEEEEESGRMAVRLNSLSIETAVTEEEAEEGLVAELEMKVEEDRGSEGEEEGGGTQRSLEALELLTQEYEPSGTRLVDAYNG